MSVLTPHQQNALIFNKHISLTANAGSGKTFVLSKRFIEIALSADVSLRNIAAITFTDKAASELYKKIASQIEEKIREEKDEILLKKLEKIRRQLVSANISTIHSFCIDILREYPVEAELDANFTPIDENLSTELIELSTEETIKEALVNNEENEHLKYLIRIFASKSKFEQELISLIKNRKNVLNISEKIYSKNIEEIADFFHCSFLKFSEEIFNRNKEYFIKALSEVNRTIIDEQKKNPAAVEVEHFLILLQKEKNHISFNKILKNIKDLICTSQNKIGKKYLKVHIRECVEIESKFVEETLKEIDNFIIPENHTELEIELALFGKRIIYFFEKALKKYEEKKLEQGYLDFEDILLHTKKILSEDLVKTALSEKYKYLMVDEYQDTNELQYNIFLPILDYLKSGNLFIVGDEKQSIYMFRDAELKVFNQTKKDIEEIEGRSSQLQLPDSFRMAPALCLFTNYIFKNLFAEPDLLFNEVAHSDLVCARNDDEKGSIEFLIPQLLENDSGDKYPEAELTAKKIIKLVEENNNLSWGDIAVLCRKRKSFNELEKILINYKIPYLILGGKGFYQKQSIYDLYNYFSFLLDNKNDTALIGILRSPFFTISDSQIYELSLLTGKTFWQKMKTSDDEALVKIKGILEENIELAHFYDLTAMLRKILHETEYLSVLSSKINSTQELANINKLIKLTVNFTMQGFKTLYDYVNFLNESINEMEDEAQAAVADESDAIKIMTLHQSKGLEFPVVFLYNSDNTAQKSALRAKDITVSKEFGILAKLPYKNNYFNPPEAAPIININNLISKRKDLAELKRLLYVGITRAKNKLFITATEKKPYSEDSFKGLLESGLNNNFTQKIITLKSSLNFLKKNDEKYFNEMKQIELKIPITKYIDEFIFPVENTKEEPGERILKHYEIKDIPKEEIISATKMAVYKQCPLKYQLTYELGFSFLVKNYKDFYKNKLDKIPYEFNLNEQSRLIEESDENSENNFHNYSEVKGRIIHRILQKEISKEAIKDFAINQVRKELNLFDYDLTISEKIVEDIVYDLNKYYNSNIYTELKQFKKYENEYEVYLKENDYYLYGIIDKLIIEENKIIIVDYKTDDIKEENISERAVNYLNQLKFYSYITNKLFRNIREFELRLLFIKHPEKFVKAKITVDELSAFENEIKTMVNNIRTGTFEKTLNHCEKCFFAVQKNKCIVH